MADVAECYEKHANASIRFAATMVGPDAEDVVSAAVVGVLRVPGDDIADLRAYLYRSVANAARKHWRSLDRRTRRERMTTVLDVTESPDVVPEVVRAVAAQSPAAGGTPPHVLGGPDAGGVAARLATLAAASLLVAGVVGWQLLAGDDSDVGTDPTQPVTDRQPTAPSTGLGPSVAPPVQPPVAGWTELPAPPLSPRTGAIARGPAARSSSSAGAGRM